ncbi:hypothetical protein [Methylobrevis pamukkalensis]|uniref:Uncharacterized protein n=1 Tax=Methylobrevis pamukkalensis TaxID=1439726 RepID=A0A1E3H5N3_9HYPH|nr:hypothetical protein [Methylobrevis pamukkalensis]ODN71614.1 hypothetical protein A6302_01035 [Methylobrevis pamukkalensis]
MHDLDIVTGGRLKILALVVAAATISACQGSSGGGSAAPSVAATPAESSLTVALAGGGWDGVTVPAGQQCRLFGGSGSTPPLRVANLPAGTTDVIVAFNDRTYKPLSSNGGHGIVGFRVPAGTASTTLPSVPGETASLPAPAYLVAKTRAPGKYAAPGYLPPCSGGRGNAYFAVVTATDGVGTVLAEGSVELGRY